MPQLNFRAIDKKLDAAAAPPAAKTLFRALARKPKGFKMEKDQAERQADSSALLTHMLAEWENGRLRLHPDAARLIQ